MKINEDHFLWPEEEKLAVHILQVHQNHFVFEDSQRGSFREDYFSPYIIPVVPHVPWAFKNIPIPLGIQEHVIDLLREKIAAADQRFADVGIHLYFLTQVCERLSPLAWQTRVNLHRWSQLET